MDDLPASSTASVAVAWAGAAAFVLSLNGGFVTILWGMRGGGASAPALTNGVINALLFTAFALHHSLLARTGAKRAVRSLAGEHLERSIYVWIASLLYMMTWALWRELPGTLYRHTGIWAAAHWIVVLLGFVFTFAAARLIDPLDLAGVNQAARKTALATPLEVAGPYHLVRHPIYLGWLLIVFGNPEMTWTRLEFAVISSTYLVVAIPFEERSLVDVFGDAYRAYQRDVRWRIVPGIW
jgi:protein-S-isoprenylcysteine O-methyltransferase Ste14